MKATIKLFTTDGLTSNGYPVKLVVTHLGKQKRLTLGHAQIDHWDTVSELPNPGHPYFESLYDDIHGIRSKAGARTFKSYVDVGEALDFITGKTRQQNVLLSTYFNTEIAKLNAAGRHGTAATYKSARNVFDNFAGDIFLQSINRDFVRRFRAEMNGQVSDKTLIEYIGTLRALFNKALDDPKIKLVDNGAFQNATRGLTRKKRRRKQRYLSQEDLKRFAQAQLEVEREIVARDLSMLQFYLGGLNLKDLYFLRCNRFFGNRVLLERSKLGKYSFEFDLLVPDPARAIFEKYTDFSGEYVFPWRMDYTGYKTFLRRHNLKLLNIQEKLSLSLLPLDENLNSNTFRHCFATYAKRHLIDRDIVDELQGRESNEILDGYQPVHLEKVRDAAHLKIIDLG